MVKVHPSGKEAPALPPEVLRCQNWEVSECAHRAHVLARDLLRSAAPSGLYATSGYDFYLVQLGLRFALRATATTAANLAEIGKGPAVYTADCPARTSRAIQ